LCTVVLFVFDEGISREQQSTIEQLVRHRRLSPAQKERIANAVKSFPSTAFVTVTVPDAEPWDFVMDIADALKAYGWNWASCVDPNGRGLKPLDPDPRPSSCTSILDHIQINAPSGLEAAANALAASIREPAIIGMDDVRVEINDKVPTIVIMVGSKR